MKKRMEEKYGKKCRGRLFLKKTTVLAIAGSVKARGGIYEVLKHTEDLALAHGLPEAGEGYEHLGDPEEKEIFQRLYHSGGIYRKSGTEHRHYQCCSGI